MVSITSALRQIKSDLGRWLSPAFIIQVCSEFGHVWRDRLLDPVIIMIIRDSHLFPKSDY